jgi:hypothetical protein
MTPIFRFLSAPFAQPAVSLARAGLSAPKLRSASSPAALPNVEKEPAVKNCGPLPPRAFSLEPAGLCFYSFRMEKALTQSQIARGLLCHLPVWLQLSR